LPQDCSEIVAADVEKAVVSLILQRDESTQGASSLSPAGFDLFYEIRRLTVVLSARATAERPTASSIGCGDAGEYRDRRRRAAVLHVAAFASDQLGDLEELTGMVEPCSGIPLGTLLRPYPAPRHQSSGK
jgi:hypothetical protein